MTFILHRYLRFPLRPRIPLRLDGDGATMIEIEEVTPKAWRSLARS